ncbi:hypothetical protein LCGC14_2379920, partial [marine sediment metagenome]
MPSKEWRAKNPEKARARARHDASLYN